MPKQVRHDIFYGFPYYDTVSPGERMKVRGTFLIMKNSKRAIEESFPIVEINRLAVPERNAFKPIYQMHKWFARRASCVFRAILLGAMKPAGTDIMNEFYKDHTHDPDTNGVRILDPFMGGGTTVVEALRLGCHVTGIDLNPVVLRQTLWLYT
jgi:adenine-specific DNA methylase